MNNFSEYAEPETTREDTQSMELKPSREGYIQMLTMIIERSSNADDVEYAKTELAKQKLDI